MDSKSLSESINGLNLLAEKRLLTDLFVLRESYGLRAHTEVL